MRRILCALLLVLSGSAVLAHGTGYEILESRQAVVIQLFYVGGEPMPYVEAKVYSPLDAAAPFQQGRADKLGRLAFYPDRPGNWRIVAIDSEGHAVRGDITVASDLITASSASTGQEAKSLRRWLFISLLGNLGLFLFILMRVDQRMAQWRIGRKPG